MRRSVHSAPLTSLVPINYLKHTHFVHPVGSCLLVVVFGGFIHFFFLVLSVYPFQRQRQQEVVVSDRKSLLNQPSLGVSQLFYSWASMGSKNI